MSDRRRRGRRGAGVGLLAALAAVAVAVALLVATRGGGTTSRSVRGAAAAARTAAATALEPASAGTAPTTVRIVRLVYGHGTHSAAVVRPRGGPGPLPTVLFLHGWGYQRPQDYRRWIDHLARRGNAVIVPKYQNDAYSDPAGVRAAMLAGLRAALSHVKIVPRTFVVAGHSAGAAMAADYAAVASAEGLPRPLAVYAVYPGRRIIGTPGIPAEDPARIPGSTRLVVLAGASDVIVGQQPARELRAGATAIPGARRRFVLVRDARVSDHLAPLRSSRVARRTFWRGLDRLISAARGTPAP